MKCFAVAWHADGGRDLSDSAEEMGANRKVFAAMAMKRNGAAALELARLSV